jgi:hypothetical protein
MFGKYFLIGRKESTMKLIVLIPFIICFFYNIFYGQDRIVTLTDGTILSGNHIRFSFSGGPSFLVASNKRVKEMARVMGLTQQESDKYDNQLKSGWSGSGSCHYVIHGKTGIGIDYRYFTTRASEWVTINLQGGANKYNAEIMEDMRVSYIGPSLLTILPLGKSKKWMIGSSLSAGIMLYRDEASLLQSNVILKGKALGAEIDADIEYFLTRKISLGAGFRLFSSRLKKVTYETGGSETTIKLDKDKYENVSTVDLTARLTIYL